MGFLRKLSSQEKMADMNSDWPLKVELLSIHGEDFNHPTRLASNMKYMVLPFMQPQKRILTYIMSFGLSKHPKLS